MVNLIDMPEMISTTAAARSEPVAPAANPAMIEIDDLSFAYGNHQVLHEVSLQIPARAVTAFIGPSGCGKTTLLRCLNRMNDLIDSARITHGTIRIEDREINAPDQPDLWALGRHADSSGSKCVSESGRRVGP